MNAGRPQLVLYYYLLSSFATGGSRGWLQASNEKREYQKEDRRWTPA